MVHKGLILLLVLAKKHEGFKMPSVKQFWFIKLSSVDGKYLTLLGDYASTT